MPRAEASRHFKPCGDPAAWTWYGVVARPKRQTDHAAVAYGATSVLRVLLDSAIDSQPLADEVIAACGEPKGPSRDLIRAGTKLQVMFHRVRQDLEALDLDDDLLEFREQASAHVLYHQWMLRESLDAALSYRVRNRAPSAGSTA